MSDDQHVLRMRSVLDRDGLRIADVACRHRAGRGEDGEWIADHGLVLVRRGCFVRSVEGVETLFDSTVAYCANPGDEQRYDHPNDDGDDCTHIAFSDELASSLWGGEPRLPRTPLAVTPQVDLQHRLLVGAARSGADPDVLAERSVTLAADLLSQTDERRVASGRPATERARRALADGVREILAEDPSVSLPALAQALATSPHHLSRTFRTVTGHTISRHRMRLRVRAALERLSAGERDLARLAADVGFADQSHLWRVVRDETGETPSALRNLLA